MELAADLLAKVERAIERCTREADQQVNDHHFQGRSPSAEICQQLKAGDQVTWAVYLGLFKHEQAWPCLRKALNLLLPGRYWLHPRFRLDDRTGQWEFLDKKRVEEIVAKQGWKGWMNRVSSSACTISSSPVRKAILPGGRSTAKAPGWIGFKESAMNKHSGSLLASSHLDRESSGNRKRYSP
ncbi:hypothetical protein [Cystobacter fuscus]|uniref:hypothetical protein n=1 Tax=Cystobacter fuscus TaxID=43 RepID=UPI002B296A7A|nr:hypothetical protein F0U63_01835 [Cystobacter fuscus]